MVISKLQRVMWRLRKNNPGERHPSTNELRRAIMYECGVSKVTYYSNKEALTRLGWIKGYNSVRVTLTDKDLTDS